MKRELEDTPDFAIIIDRGLALHRCSNCGGEPHHKCYKEAIPGRSFDTIVIGESIYCLDCEKEVYMEGKMVNFIKLKQKWNKENPK